METMFCVECQEFLDIKLFALKNRRTICKAHANLHIRQKRLKKWAENPLTQKAYEVWQIACVDSSRTFKTVCGISERGVFALMQIHDIGTIAGLRLVPVDPTKPVSASNYCFTSAVNKTDMYRVWRMLHSTKNYMLFISPEMKRPVYGTSTTSQIESEVAVVDQTCNVSRTVVCV